MASNTARLARLFTPLYASHINAQLVYPASSIVVKPDELASALIRPLQTATYEPHQPPEYLAATLAFGVINGHPFMDDNKRTAFFLANEYLRAHGLPAITDASRTTGIYKSLDELADRFIGAAAAELTLQDLASAIPSSMK